LRLRRRFPPRAAGTLQRLKIKSGRAYAPRLRLPPFARLPALPALRSGLTPLRGSGARWYVLVAAPPEAGKALSGDFFGRSSHCPLPAGRWVCRPPTSHPALFRLRSTAVRPKGAKWLAAPPTATLRCAGAIAPHCVGAPKKHHYRHLIFPPACPSALALKPQPTAIRQLLRRCDDQ